MSPINIPPEGKGSIRLTAYAFINGRLHDCIIIEASATTQRALVVVRGSVFMQTVPFRSIANVALVYDDGTVARSFGAPRVSNPESLDFVQDLQVWQ